LTNLPAIQDFYAENTAHCYGCGRLNERGLHIRSVWQGDELVCVFTPEAFHTALPEFVYGGLIASLIDCHSTGTAAAVAQREEGIPLGHAAPPRFVTAMLKVDYLKPTPLNTELTVRARATEIKPRKVIVESTLFANGVACARGNVVAVRVGENFGSV